MTARTTGTFAGGVTGLSKGSCRFCRHSAHLQRVWKPQVFWEVGAGGLMPARGAPTGTPLPQVARESPVREPHAPWAPRIEVLLGPREAGEASGGLAVWESRPPPNPHSVTLGRSHKCSAGPMEPCAAERCTCGKVCRDPRASGGLPSAGPRGLLGLESVWGPCHLLGTSPLRATTPGASLGTSVLFSGIPDWCVHWRRRFPPASGAPRAAPGSGREGGAGVAGQAASAARKPGPAPDVGRATFLSVQDAPSHQSSDCRPRPTARKLITEVLRPAECVLGQCDGN